MRSECQEFPQPDLLQEVSKHIHWQATMFRKDCEKISARLEKSQIDQEQAQLQLSFAYELYMNFFQIIKQIAFPVARELGSDGKRIQRIQDAITLQGPVMREKYEIFMGRINPF